MSDINHVLDHIDSNLENSINRLCDLVAIPSVSTDPAYADHCLEAAGWLSDRLSEIGFDASVRPTTGHPMVVAHYTPKNAIKGAPHVLFYGHYDVQPADPVELWETPPFEATRKTGENGSEHIVARGVHDDKGQLMTFVEACSALMAVEGDLPLPITVMFEGEEECGSPSLAKFLEENAEELKADHVLVCDTNMWNEDTPAITVQLRGMVYEEVIITGPQMDLHSGSYGGAARNPVRVLARIIADLHDDTGHITVPGFYDGVKELAQDLKAQWDGLDFSEADFLGEIGLEHAAGEEGRSVLEQVWSRPTCDVNGIISGYTGEGSKTVIPSVASAKISFRLVGKQNPEEIIPAFRAFVEARVPEDCKVEFLSHSNNPPIEMSTGNQFTPIAACALQEEFGQPTVLMGCGGSIPIVGNFKNQLGMDSLLIGFGLVEDRIHSPNEKYEVKSFHKGTRSWARILKALAAGG